MYIHTYTHICIYTYTYAYKFIHIYMYIYIYRSTTQGTFWVLYNPSGEYVRTTMNRHSAICVCVGVRVWVWLWVWVWLCVSSVARKDFNPTWISKFLSSSYNSCDKCVWITMNLHFAICVCVGVWVCGCGYYQWRARIWTQHGIRKWSSTLPTSLPISWYRFVCVVILVLCFRFSLCFHFSLCFVLVCVFFLVCVSCWFDFLLCFVLVGVLFLFVFRFSLCFVLVCVFF